MTRQGKLDFTVRPDSENSEMHDVLYRYGYHSFTTENLIELRQTIDDYLIENKLQKKTTKIDTLPDKGYT